MTKRVALIGASGHGKVVADLALANGASDIFFYDDRWREIGNFYGIPVVGDIEQSIRDSNGFDSIYVAIGNNSIRAKFQALIQNIGEALVHPSACVSASAKLGRGTVVMPHAVINANAAIGLGVIINSGAVIEHDCRIGDFTHICPQTALAGGVQVGTQSWIGIGASIIQLKEVGSYATVGAGAVVIKSVDDHQTVVGNPAKPIKR